MNKDSLNQQPDAYLANFASYEDFLNEIGNSNIDTLIKKYGQNKLIDKIFTINNTFFSFKQFLDLQKQFYILKFCPPNEKVPLTENQKTEIINTMASVREEHEANQILSWLKAISPKLIYPENFEQAYLQKTAYLVYVAYNNIIDLVLGETATEYLLDTVHFYNMKVEDLKNLETEITPLSKIIAEEYQKLVKDYTYQVDSDVLKRVTKILISSGRSQMFVNNANEDSNFGEIADIFIKFDVAIKAAMELKKQEINSESLQDKAIEEIKKILMPGVSINL